MDLQTFVKINQPSHFLIDYNSKILLLGSCFSNNIGAQLDFYKFDVLQNPFGILFNPIAIENLIVNSIHQREIDRNLVVFNHERWHFLNAHSDLSSGSQLELFNKLKAAQKNTFEYLKKASHVFITLGTAWVYKHLASENIVANCHKIPQKEFEKVLLTTQQIEESLQNIVKNIRKINGDVSIIFTISPVRHAKNGLIENNISKAHLITAVYQILNSENRLFYFPAYEIMMDELRDYRFYTADMLHPNETAIKYIWNKFSEIWIEQSSKNVMQKVAEIQKDLQHKAFNPESESHHHFLKSLDEKITELQQKLPNISFK